jgi:hypothetical protein
LSDSTKKVFFPIQKASKNIKAIDRTHKPDPLYFSPTIPRCFSLFCFESHDIKISRESIEIAGKSKGFHANIQVIVMHAYSRTIEKCIQSIYAVDDSSLATCKRSFLVFFHRLAEEGIILTPVDWPRTPGLFLSSGYQSRNIK